MIKLLVILALFTVARGQRGSFQGSIVKPLCAEQGNYCKENADCCSKACLTDSHKCTVSYGPGIALLPSPPKSTTASSLDNRFGNEGGNCRQDGDNCQMGIECCSGECFTPSRRCIRRNENQINNSGGFQGQPGAASQSTCGRENQQCSPSQNCCTFFSCEGNICRDNSLLILGTETLGFNPSSNNLTNRFGEEENATNQTEVTAAPANVKCAEIGSKCYKESDCCQNLKCHGFLHKCVT